MTQIAGLHYETDTHGQLSTATFDFGEIHNTRVAEIIEDLIDGMEAQAVMDANEPTMPLEDFMKDEYQRRGIMYREYG